eukprot:jgi/Picsp_1/5966/NSC_03321-R1_---NA---
MISLSISMDLGNKRSICSVSDFRPARPLGGRPSLCGTEGLLMKSLLPSYAARMMMFRWFCIRTREQNIRRWHGKHPDWEIPAYKFDVDCTTIVLFAKVYDRIDSKA